MQGSEMAVLMKIYNSRAQPGGRNFIHSWIIFSVGPLTYKTKKKMREK